MFLENWSKEDFEKVLGASKYNKIYLELVNNKEATSIREDSSIRYENHHIIPRCFGGDDSPSNVARLTTYEHLLAHYYLALITDHVYMFNAINIMLGRQFKDISEIERVKLEELKHWSDIRDKSRKRLFSLESRKTISEKAKERWKQFKENGRIDEIRTNISSATSQGMRRNVNALIGVRANLGCKKYYNPETDEEKNWYEGMPIPEAPWVRGRRGNSKESRMKTSETLKKQKRRWYYNDSLQENRMFTSEQTIPEGWYPGQPKKYKKAGANKRLKEERERTLKKLKDLKNNGIETLE